MDLQTGEEICYKAKVFIVAAGAVLTPQLLYASNIRPPALGKYLCEQPMTFCQIVYSTAIINWIRSSTYHEVKQYIEENPNDPVPIPMDDPLPQVIILNWLLLPMTIFISHCSFIFKYTCRKQKTTKGGVG